MKRVIQPLSYPLPKSRACVQSQIINHVNSGHNWWGTGVVAVDKAEDFTRKMCARHGVDLGDSTRCYQRNCFKESGGRKGYPSVQLLLYPEGSPAVATHLRWFLLSTDRLDLDKIPPEFREHLANLDDRRLTWNEYELVHRTRARKIGGGTKWTWRLTKKAYEEQLALFEMAARKRDAWRLSQVLDAFRNRPGWGGLREQMISLNRAAKSAANRANGLPDGVDWSLMGEYVDLTVWDRDNPRTLGGFIGQIVARVNQAMDSAANE